MSVNLSITGGRGRAAPSRVATGDYDRERERDRDRDHDRGRDHERGRERGRSRHDFDCEPDRERDGRRRSTPSSTRETASTATTVRASQGGDNTARRSDTGSAIPDADDELDTDFIDRDEEPGPSPQGSTPPPSFQVLLEEALSSNSAPALENIVSKVRKPTAAQMQQAFLRLYRSDRAIQLNVLPPRPNAEEADSLSAPNKSAVRDLQEACRHNATLLQGVYALAEALVVGSMDRTSLSQLCADMLTYGFGAQDELVRRMKDIVRGAISTRFPPQEEFRYPDAFRPLDVLTEEERRQARKERDRARTAARGRAQQAGGGAARQGSTMKRQTDTHGPTAAKRHIFHRGEQKPAKEEK